MGLVIATLYSGYAVLLFLVSGEEPFARNHTSLPGVLLTYYASGVAGGAAVGALLPLGRHWWGRVIVGVVAALVFFFCVMIAREGPFWNWKFQVWENVLVLALLLGTPCALLWRRATGL